MPYSSFADLLTAALEEGSLAGAAIARESIDTGVAHDELWERMAASLHVMRESAEAGLAGQSVSRSGVVGGDAARVSQSSLGPVGGVFSRAIAIALAVAETNASMGRVVAAPTGGASGVVPGVLLALAEERGLPDDDVVAALFSAGAMGAVMASRTNLSGAAAGCQAEIGAAAAMAAAAGTEMLGGTLQQSGHAASLTLQGLLGLVCDPVGGLVEVPCVARNATATAVALSGIELALAGVKFPIPFDEVAETLASVGRSIPSTLRETAMGGLAVTPTGREIAGR